MTPLQQTPAASVDEIYRLAAFAGCRPDPKLKVSEWADRYRVLTTRSSPEPGKWNTNRTPFLREIMDALSPSSPSERVVFMKGSQIGGTECGNNWLAFIIHLAPGPVMAVQPTTEMAKRNSKQRIGPLIEDCAVLKTLVKEVRSKDSGNTILSKDFPGGILVLTGANSAKGLRSMSVRYLFLDEVDGYPGDVEGEGEPCDLAIARTSNYARRKIFIVSTPVVSGRSRIERFYEASDQCKYWVPCPHCQQKQVLHMENLRWPRGKPELAHYVCEGCGRAIYDHAKTDMLRDGEWRAAAVGDGKTRGFHLSSLYSPVGWLSWPQIARKREAAGKDREKLQVFQNTILGLPWAEVGEVPDIDRLYERRENYRIGTVPIGGLYLTAGVDVQMRRLEVEVLAWGRKKCSWSVDYRVIEGDTNQPGVWDKLARMLDEDFPSEYGGRMRIRRMAVDSGFNTPAVYDFVRRMSSQRVMACKGDRRAPAITGPHSSVDVSTSGRVTHGIRLWPINTSMAKEELYRWLRTSVPDVAAGEEWPTGFCHFPAYGKEYFDQLCSEQLVTRIKRGKRDTIWEKMRDRNEALDCRVLNRAAVASMRIEIWPDSKWDELETSLTVRHGHELDVPAAVPSAAKGAWQRSPMPEFRPISMGTSFLE